MSTSTRTTLGDLVRHIVTLSAGESQAVALDSSSPAGISVQLTVAAGDSATAHGSCDDAALVTNPATQAFPLVGEDGRLAAGAARTVAVAYPAPLRTVLLSADAANTNPVRVVVLQ